ncbi:MAG: LicD family protein [Bacteroidales bacterium]|nr:LicD family protein [Bacteroidales bacterium]
MKEISQEDYKRIPFEILKDVAGFCRINGIRYSLAYGTLLGAVRHKGFIPWDDDIDIIMPRNDFDRFRETYNSDRFVFSDLSTNKDHPTGMAKVYDPKTFFFYKQTIKRSYGLFIDVFVVDRVPEDSSAFIPWMKRIKRLMSINTAKNTGILNVFRSEKGLFRILKRLAIILIPVPRRVIQKKICQLQTKYRNDNSDSVCITVSVDNPYDIYPSSLFEEYASVEFEGMSFSAIKDYDKWLSVCYGDYMQMPPEEKQVSKHSIVAYYK